MARRLRRLPGLADFAALRRREMGFALATNNATKTAVMYTEKLARFGVDVAPEHIVTSAEATAAFLRQEYEVGTAVYVVGDKGLHDAVTAQGFTIITPEQAKAGRKPPWWWPVSSRTATYEIMAMGRTSSTRGRATSAPTPTPPSPAKSGRCPAARCWPH
ncbi:hypothetical protein [Candidatus Amarobacter glycogenicus]|uniref:hypothetical protein n=1 Tax=Candidatus Amarobacter glycogenicus TaxID=3140699 RepID=UPI002A109433|nr:hypothetical protein [Dehalococcoidia bacterium]